MLSTEFERISMSLADPFGISRGTQTEAENVVVRIEDEGGMTGVGAAAPSSHYGETADTVEAVLPDLLAVVEEVGDPHAIDRIERRMKETVRRNPAARTAVSIALHDLAAKRLGIPLYRMWGLDPDRTPSSSFTIGLDDLQTMREKTTDAYESGYDVLKVKLGTDRDKAIVEAVRDEAPGVTIRVDANEAWTPREAVEMSEFLADYGVEFIEQPVPAEDHEGLKFVYENAALPIAADESCVTVDDIPKIADRVDIANLKLMKCGGLTEAKRMIHTARAHGLEVMLGCMIETNAAIAAGCHLAPLLDYADLDGSLLLADDPYEGVPMPHGAIDLESLDRPGTGAQLL
ncbi:mandelate racemase-like protein / muconate lactonizing enzyme-like protein [Haloferax elongans ATCC BAA-1513]|uniref:Mandelate racemase-like protein / muconate lactonizing enzyme-like protein n=1 Tax=Haloferax elongans ATCC BAA-1513 TaxID=1230453 RepID=M0HJF4_HALEO|nr:dipeptide epimerase [Haloferax elongans]ELZ83224.1 mandelate racemase-like protein / muconate lactonizing enzyme-like protein [Haloferax elongans ATCC BAA-1513]